MRGKCNSTGVCVPGIIGPHTAHVNKRALCVTETPHKAYVVVHNGHTGPATTGLGCVHWVGRMLKFRNEGTKFFELFVAEINESKAKTHGRSLVSYLTG